MKNSLALAACGLISLGMMTSCLAERFSVQLVVDDKLGSTDDSFIQPAVNGLNKAIDNKNVIGSVAEGITEDDCQRIFSAQTSSTDLVICVGYKLYDSVVEAAKTKPDINYVAIDMTVDSDIQNLVGISYRVEESSFLVGYIAGMTTETNKLGFIGGSESDTIYPFDYGFRAGAEYAAKEKNCDILVTSKYLDSFKDSELGEKTADELYQSGCDIVFQAAGFSGVGAINSAVKNDKWIIGVDVDQSYLAPDNVLTSAMKNIESTVLNIIDRYKNGSEIKTGTMYMGLSDGEVGLPVNNPNVDNVILQRTLELKDLIIDGVIDPPSNQKEYNDFIKAL